MASFERIWPYLGDLHGVLPPHWAGVVLVLCSVVCGMIVGVERESKQKPAGMRTVTLICVGSTIFTLASVLIAGDSADRTRIAAQVVTGVGFLGAGAIIRDRGAIIGLTTGASIWCVAAIGMLIGGGYAGAGVVLTAVVILMLSVVGRVERGIEGRCRLARCRIVYRPEHGVTKVRLLHVLDQHHVSQRDWRIAAEGDREVLELSVCQNHQVHRTILFELAEVGGVEAIEQRPMEPGADKRTPPR